jgi:hypothetical protein
VTVAHNPHLSYMQFRFFKAYCQFKAGHRRTSPAPASYKLDKDEAALIRRFADDLFDHYYQRRRRSRRTRSATCTKP